MCLTRADRTVLLCPHLMCAGYGVEAKAKLCCRRIEYGYMTL